MGRQAVSEEDDERLFFGVVSILGIIIAAVLMALFLLSYFASIL
jgi:hypothetical protein